MSSSINPRTYDAIPARKVAFLGLGVMGYPMAGHLAKAGHQVSVYNRTSAKAEAWVKEFGGSFGLTPKDAVKDAEIVFCCVGNDDDLRSVVLGEHGAFAGMGANTIFVDHTTASAQVARELSEGAKMVANRIERARQRMPLALAPAQAVNPETGLPTRAYLMGQLANALEEKTAGGLFFLEINGALGLGAPEFIGRDLDGAHRVFFTAMRCHYFLLG